MKDSEFVFGFVNSFYYECHKRNPNHRGSHIDCPDLIKNKKGIINTINKKDNKSFQYGVTVAFNHEEIKNDPQGITKIKPFINIYKWEGRNCPSEKNG